MVSSSIRATRYIGLPDYSNFKQRQRAELIQALTKYHEPFDQVDHQTLSEQIQDLVHSVQNGTVQAADVLRTYGKVAIRAHLETNCLTEVMLKESEEWINNNTINLRGPLAGIPISLKDTVGVGGFDATVGYSAFVGNKNTVWKEDGPMVKLLKDAGAVPYVKTNVPITLLSFESANNVWGRTTNPHSRLHSPGGSTGGEAALLALGGRIGIGSDVAGSVRVPAHFSGIYSLRCSTGRWPKTGVSTSMPGQEGVPSVFSPMARTLNDLTYLTKSIISMEPWTYDHSVHPLAWRSQIADGYVTKKLHVGIMRTDGVVDPSPACARALRLVEDALRKEGHAIIEVQPPSPYEGLVLASQLINADGTQSFKSFFRYGEWEDRGARQMSWYMNLPWLCRAVYYLWVRYVRRDSIWAGLLRGFHAKSSYEYSKLISRREAYRDTWFQWWNDTALDCLLTVPNATPAVPHNGMHNSVSSCGYTFLFNLVSFTQNLMN